MLGNLADDFAAELRAILERENFLLPNEEGTLQVPCVFSNALKPVTKERPNRAPWVLVSFYIGEQASADEPLAVTLHITDMTYDANKDMQGGRDALQLIWVMCRNLYAQTIVASKYEVRYPFQVAMLDDAKYPYFAAGVAIKVHLTGIAPQNTIGGYAYV